jgi:ParB/RepB/Spo0J family partition protein
MSKMSQLLKKNTDQIRADHKPNVQEKIEFKESGKVVDIPLRYITANKKQPREDASQKVQELAKSITTENLIQPIVVNKISETIYKIEAGHRRYEAHKILNKETIRCIITTDRKNDTSFTVKALVENLQRQNLNAYEIGKAIYELRHTAPSKKTIEDIMRITGRSERSVQAYTAAYKKVLDGTITKDQLIENGIKAVSNTGGATVAPLKNDSLSPGINSADLKQNHPTKETKNMSHKIKDVSNIAELESAKKYLESRLAEVKRMIKKLKKTNGYNI